MSHSTSGAVLLRSRKQLNSFEQTSQRASVVAQRFSQILHAIESLETPTLPVSTGKPAVAGRHRIGTSVPDALTAERSWSGSFVGHRASYPGNRFCSRPVRDVETPDSETKRSINMPFSRFVAISSWISAGTPRLGVKRNRMPMPDRIQAQRLDVGRLRPTATRHEISCARWARILVRSLHSSPWSCDIEFEQSKSGECCSPSRIIARACSGGLVWLTAS